MQLPRDSASSLDRSDSNTGADLADNAAGTSASGDETSEPGPAQELVGQTRHTYLGEVDDLEGGGIVLDTGQICHLPLIPLEGIVLMPGDTLPLKVVRRQDRAKLEAALSAAAPYTRLIAVVCMTRSDPGAVHLHSVGCTAEIRQISRQDDVMLNIVAKGGQRLQLDLYSLQHGQDLSQAQQTITADVAPTYIPPEAGQGIAYWPLRVWNRYDAFGLAQEATSLFNAMAPKVRQLQGDPLALSYWLASNLPLEDDTRQRLLEAPTVVERLKNEVALMQRMTSLRCRYCMTEVASARDVLSMSNEGTGGAFVNSHGYVHDMITLHRATNTACEGEPETEHSWFPGYAWTIAYCAGCANHLGWMFTAAQPNLVPGSFWGLRRPAITELDEARRNMLWHPVMHGLRQNRFPTAW